MTEDKQPTTTRRGILGAISVGAGLFSLRASAATASAGLSFSHGVASGDPCQNKVILWTRVIDTADKAKNIVGTWQMSRSQSFETLVTEGTFKTGPQRDFTVKVEAKRLKADTIYYYRFITADQTSPVGRTRTLPTGNSPVELAVVSCSNFSHGHFHVYKELAQRDYQAVLHLGDYIYEYAEGIYDNEAVLAQGRTSKPKTEIISLDDYRRRYAHYRTDPDLLAAHAAHPFICIWDDHEVANDTWKDGAENHNDGEGNFKARQKAAMQAYMEWLPIRDTPETQEGKIYRSFDLGNLASLIMLDTRHIGRDRGLRYETDLPMRTIPFDFTQPESPVALLDKIAFEKANPEAIKHITVPFLLEKDRATPMTDWSQIKTLDPKNLPKGYSYLPDTERFKNEILGNKARSILGAEQEAWFTKQLKLSKEKEQPWQIIGQQLLTGKLGIPQLKDSDIEFEKSDYFTREQMGFFRMLGQLGLPLNLDAWDGYPACRDRIYKTIKENANNAVYLAGDTHNAWAFDLSDHEQKPIGVEFATPGISSPGLENYIPVAPETVRTELLKASPELRFANTKDRGWLSLKVTSEAINAQWHFVSSVITPDYSVDSYHSATVEAGRHTIASD